MKLILGLAFGATMVIIGAVLAIPILIGQTPNTHVVEDRPERFFPPPGFEPPFSHSYNYERDFVAFRDGTTYAVRIDQGLTKTVTLRINPNERFETGSVFHIELDQSLEDPAIRTPGVLVDFKTSDLLVTPGQPSSFDIVITVLPTAPHGAYRMEFDITSNAFPGKFSPGFELIIGNADPIPIDNPIVQEPPP